MKNEKKNNKKQIDAEINRVLLSDFDKIENFVVSRWKHMLVGAGVIIVLVAVAYGILLKKENNELAAANAIANAETKEELVTVIERYGTYSQADAARIRLAEKYVAEKDFDAALQLYKAVSLNSQDQDIKCRMLLDIAYVTEMSGKYDDAVKAFADIANNAMYSAGVRAEANYSAARLSLKNGKKEEAAKFFDKLYLLNGDQAAMPWIINGKALQGN